MSEEDLKAIIFGVLSGLVSNALTAALKQGIAACKRYRSRASEGNAAHQPKDSKH